MSVEVQARPPRARDKFNLGYALVHAIVALEQLPLEKQPKAQLDDLRELLSDCAPRDVALMMAMAKCRLQWWLKPSEREQVYLSYGITL